MFSRTSANYVNKFHIAHLLHEFKRARLFDFQQRLDFFVRDVAVLRDIVEHLLHLRGHRRSLLRRGGGHGVHIGQNNFERIGSYFDLRLFGAIGIQVEYSANAGAVTFNQAQTMEHLGKILVSGLRDAGTNIVWGKAGKKTAERNKLHLWSVTLIMILPLKL